MSLNFILLILMQFSTFILSVNISQHFKLDKSLYLINIHRKVYNISLYFTNNYSSNFYSNKIFINGIHIDKENCNIILNKIECLIDENLNKKLLFLKEILKKFDKKIFFFSLKYKIFRKI